MRLDVLAELAGLGVLSGWLIGGEAKEDFRSWTHTQKILAPMRQRLNRKRETQWQRKVVALFRLGEAARAKRRG